MCGIIVIGGVIMRVSITKSKNYEFIYIIKDFYNNKSRTSKVYEKLGKIDDLCAQKNMTRDEVVQWAKNYAKELTKLDQENSIDKVVSLSPNKIIDMNSNRKFNCGYLFLQSLFYQLRFDKVCRNIKGKYNFDYDLCAILSDLVYSRILFPSSKRSSFEHSKQFLEKRNYELHDVYRALSVLAKESDYVQSELYKNSNFVKERNTATLYYDCTNYYFEIEEDDDFRKYGKSKEHRPNPIVGMGLFMDGDGIPLAFDLFEGNRNEQTTLKPLEEKIIRDFNLSKFIYCSDAGLASKANKKFNSIGERAYIITQSLKKLKKEDNEVALKRTGFMELGESSKKINIDDIDFSIEENRNKLYYKEIPIIEPLEERMIVTYSPKYAAYQKNIREKQILRAKKMIQKDGKIKKTTKNPNNPARFIEKCVTDENGVVIEEHYILDIEKIKEEEKYDGFYAITTNLEDDDVRSILAVSERRWQIEECFRIMKSDFKARPVYLQKEDRIKAHFLTCFISLVIYRFLEFRLGNKYTVSEILNTLRDMEMVETQYNGYIPAYTRTEITDKLHEIFNFRTDYEIISKQKMRNIIKNTK